MAIIGGYVFLFLFDNAFHSHNFCFFKLITGVACPGCGMGRATICLIKGKIAESLSYNLLAIPFNLFIFIVCIWLVYDIFKKKNTFYEFTTKPLNSYIKIIIFFILIINWIINIYRNI
ncbi:MAG: DUF2752 domain-containing protein [Bacteroidales bacterium]|nr:DUF2752 domain-containing protein [Bacteroidales bacterium]